MLQSFCALVTCNYLSYGFTDWLQVLYWWNSVWDGISIY